MIRCLRNELNVYELPARDRDHLLHEAFIILYPNSVQPDRCLGRYLRAASHANSVKRDKAARASDPDARSDVLTSIDHWFR